MIPKYTHPEMAGVWSEEHKLDTWLRVEVAVCEAWAELGAIPEQDMAAIRGATVDPARVQQLLQETHHDVISFIRAVAETVGPPGRFIHLGLTSSDVLDTAMAVQVLEATEILDRDLQALEAAATALALRHKLTPMIGRTHGIHAEPTTFGHKMALWVWQTRRNRKRLAHAREEMAVGKISGAVGTHANVPAEVEEKVCARLGLQPAAVSSQIVQRDHHAYFIATLAVIAATLEQMATEVRGLQRTEVGEVAEPFSAGQQGSSAMPHKRNPELAERVCGLARLIRGYAGPALDDVPLWHERDISHSSVERIIFPDACLALDYILRIFTKVLEGLDVFPERMQQNLELTRGLVYSGRVLLALVEAGMGRNDAYQLVQSSAKRVWAGASDLKSLLWQDERVRQVLREEQLDELFDPGYHMRGIGVAYRRLGLE